MGPGRRPAPQALRPDPEPRRDGQGLRGARARDVRGGHRRRAPRRSRRRASREQAQAENILTASARPALRRRRGLPAAARDRELPAAPGAARATSSRRSPSRARSTTTPCSATTTRSRPSRRTSSPGCSTSTARVLPDRGRDPAEAPQVSFSDAPAAPAAPPEPRSRPAGQTASAAAQSLAARGIALAAVALLVPASRTRTTSRTRTSPCRSRRTARSLVAEKITFVAAPSTAPTATSRSARASRSTASPSRRATAATRRGGCTKLGSIDRPTRSTTRRTDKRVRIVWHFLAAGEPRTFTIRYRFRGLTVAYDDVVDVNLKVWGAEWPSRSANLTASMTAPRPTRSARATASGGTRRGCTATSRARPRAATLRAVNVPADQFVELRVVFPRTLLTSTAGAKVVRGNGLATIVAEERGRRRPLPARPRADRRREEPPRPHAALPARCSRSARRSP